MSKQYDNTNSGILARNDRKEKDTHPDFTGSLNVEGTEYWLSAWVNEGRPGTKFEGKKYFSIKVNPKEQQRSAPKPTSRFKDDPSIDEDIPF